MWLLPAAAQAQCVGIPSVTSLGSNKFPSGLCAPVLTQVTYSIGFAVPVQNGTLELVYDWGDGSALEIVPLTPGEKTYNASRTHTYPGESDCEYFVTMSMRFNGDVCTGTYQIQKISSWRTDAYNGGEVQLISPDTKTEEHLVCEGQAVDVVFEDKTDWNCNSLYLHAGNDPIESPNIESRWQQIVYNTTVTGNKLPNVKVNGIAVTAADGSDLKAHYQDPRGVHSMSAPVLVGDARRRPSLRITAPGGFGAGFPKAGDVFAVTLRYWNVCNPYDDPEIPGPPADVLNGDHAPVEKKALIRVLAPPPALTATEQAVCAGSTPKAFTVTGLTEDNVVNWYAYVPGSDVPGELIASDKSPTLAISAHPNWKNKNTPGVLKVWATQRADASGAGSCESSPVLVTRIIREKLAIPPALTPIPGEICNGQTFTAVLPAPVKEVAGGPTQYLWTTSSGLSITSSDEGSVTIAVDVQDFGAALFADKTITVTRQYVSGPKCAVSTTYDLRVYRAPEGGAIEGASQVCDNTAVGMLTLHDFSGDVAGWEVKKDDGAYTTYTGEAAVNGIMPGLLPAGVYVFRARVQNGPCKKVYSDEQKVVVSTNPGEANAGEDQYICTALSSAALNANFPDIGQGRWTYVSSVPSGLPPPSFSENDPHTTVVISAANAGIYNLRWTFTNGSCISFDDVLIDFGTNPTNPDAGEDQAVCGTTASLEGNIPEKGQGIWTIVSGPDGCAGEDCAVSLDAPTAPTATVALTGTAPRYGSYTFRWNISSGGNNCFLKTDDVTLIFEEPVRIDAADISGICLDRESLTPIELAGVVEGPVAHATWTLVSGHGIVSSTMTSADGDDLRVSATYTPSQADFDAGVPVTFRLRASALGGSCDPQEKIVALHFERKPVAEAGPDVENICGDSVSLAASDPLYGASGLWTTNQPGVIFEDATDPKTTLRNLPTGTTLVTWTVSAANGVCPDQSSSVLLTRVAPPQATDVTVTECAVHLTTTNVVLTGYEDLITNLPEAAREIAWFKIEGTSSSPVANPSATQVDVAHGQVFLARIHDIETGCSSDAHVTVHVRKKPAAMNAVIRQCEDLAGSNTVSGIDLYQDSFVHAITSSPDVSVSWFSTEADARSESFRITAPVLVTGQKEFFGKVVYTDAPHCFSIARLNVVVNPQPGVTTIVGRESVCQSTSSSFFNDLPVQVYQVTPIPGARYHWDIPDDPDTAFRVFGGGGEGDFYVLLQFPNVYTGKIRVRAELNGCSSATVEKVIAVSASPATPVIDGRSVVCENDAHISFRVRPDNYPASAYNWEIRRASDNSVGGASIMEGQLTGNILVNFRDENVIISVRESNAECVSPVATRVITVSDPPKAELAIENDITCFMAGDGAIRTEVTGGTAPYRDFEIVQTGQMDTDNDGMFDNLMQGTYSVRLTDANGCSATTNVVTLAQPERVEVDFSITPPADLCTGDAFMFSWQAEAGVDYRWEWGDGTSTEISADEISQGENQLAHTFMPLSGVKSSNYAVALFARNPGCSETGMRKSVSVPSVMKLNIAAQDTLLCSGEDVRFTNLSTGVSAGQWLYRIKGGAEWLAADRPDDMNVTFPLYNLTSSSAVTYEVRYEAGNAFGCTSQFLQDVIVYRTSTASFDVGSVPAFEHEPVAVALTNTSDVLDPTQFGYRWYYGAQGSAVFASLNEPFEVMYHSPGKKDIRLQVINLEAEQAGKICESISREQITIAVSALKASFTVTPFASCYPVTFAVQNTTTGADTFLWKVFRSGALVTTSNLRYPEFRITQPGVYDIQLTASLSGADRQDYTELKGLTVFDAPKASFEVRSDLIYVPDTPMEVMNFSTNATHYDWYFGDGTTADAFEPSHTYQEEGRYSVVLVAGYDHGMVDSDGDGVADKPLVCYDSARREVVALRGGEIRIPNAFTPDTSGPNGGYATSGGFNDVFLPMVKGAAQFHMQIYDRWGTLVFESRDRAIGWDGYGRDQRLMPAGVYVYKISVVQSNGETLTRAGDVSLIR